LGDWIGIRGELIGCHGTNGALRWLPTASLAEISLFVESGKESYLNRKVGLVHSHLSLIIDDLASCSSKHPAYQFIILGAQLAPSYLRYSFFVTLVMTFRKKSRLPGHSSDSSSLIEPSRKKSVEVGPPLQLIKSAFFSVMSCTYSPVIRKNGFLFQRCDLRARLHKVYHQWELCFLVGKCLCPFHFLLLLSFTISNISSTN